MSQARFAVEVLREKQIEEYIAEAQKLAALFDKQRHCGWNSMQDFSEYYGEDTFTARNLPAFASLGSQCHGTIIELALLQTLRPCKHCGADTIFKGGYMLSCCSCLGDGCEDCAEASKSEEGEDCGGGCDSYAENANLQDAITKWNIQYGDDGTTGRVQVVG